MFYQLKLSAKSSGLSIQPKNGCVFQSIGFLIEQLHWGPEYGQFLYISIGICLREAVTSHWKKTLLGFIVDGFGASSLKCPCVQCVSTTSATGPFWATNRKRCCLLCVLLSSPLFVVVVVYLLFDVCFVFCWSCWFLVACPCSLVSPVIMALLVFPWHASVFVCLEFMEATKEVQPQLLKSVFSVQG